MGKLLKQATSEVTGCIWLAQTLLQEALVSVRSGLHVLLA